MTNAFSARSELLCSARATNSLPVPLSPLTRTVDRLAAWTTRSNTWRILPLRPMMLANLLPCDCRFCLRMRFSARQARALDGVAEHAGDFVVLERLGDVVEGAPLHRRERGLDRREGGDHHDRQVLVHRPELAEHGEAVHAGHHDVDDSGVEGLRPRQLEPVHAVDGKAHVEPLCSSSVSSTSRITSSSSMTRIVPLAVAMLQTFWSASARARARHAVRAAVSAGKDIVNRVPCPT